MKKVVAIHNEKGGVGKTTTAINLSVALAAKGKKILLVDLDTQANLSKSLLDDYAGFDYEEIGIADVANGTAKFEDVIQPVSKNISIIPAARSLQNVMMNSYVFDFSPLDYDFVFLDCPPFVTLIAVAAMNSADEIIIPAMCAKFDIDGVLNDIRNAKNFGVKIAGVLITNYIERLVVSKIVMRDLIAKSKEQGFKVFDTKIRANVAVIEAHIMGQDIFSYDPNCAAASDYKKFANEFLKGEKKNGKK